METPCDFCLVRLDKAFQDQIITESGVTLFKDTWFRPEWNVTVTGEVVSAPEKIRAQTGNIGRDMQAAGMEIPSAGTQIIFSYMVVYDMEQRDGDTPIHHNLWYINGEWLWKVDLSMILGTIEGGRVQAAAGYVFCEELQEAQPERAGLIWLPQSKIREKKKGRARVVSAGSAKAGVRLSVEEGDIIRFPDRFAQRYEIMGKEYLLLDHRYVAGREVRTPIEN